MLQPQLQMLRQVSRLRLVPEDTLALHSVICCVRFLPYCFRQIKPLCITLVPLHRVAAQSLEPRVSARALGDRAARSAHRGSLPRLQLTWLSGDLHRGRTDPLLYHLFHARKLW